MLILICSQDHLHYIDFSFAEQLQSLASNDGWWCGNSFIATTAHPLVDQNLLYMYSSKVCHLQEKNHLEFTHSTSEVLGIIIL